MSLSLNDISGVFKFNNLNNWNSNDTKALADDLKKELDEASIKVARIIKEDEEKEFTPDGL